MMRELDRGPALPLAGSDHHGGRRSQWIARLIIEHIESHDLVPGAKLPSENALAQRFSVSRSVIREAIAMLRAEGRVETVQGSGAFVRLPDAGGPELDTLTQSSVKSLIDLIGVRRVVESEIAAIAAVERTREAMAAIDRALDRLRRVQQAGALGVIEDRAFHASIADACGNDYWRKVVQALARPIEVAIGVTRSNEALSGDLVRAVDEEHGAIRDAIAAGDPDQARAAAVRHMECSAQRILSADRAFWRTGGGGISRLSQAD